MSKVECDLVEYKNNVVEIRLVDDGHGMVEKMLPVAIRWEASRHGSKLVLEDMVLANVSLYESWN